MNITIVLKPKVVSDFSNILPNLVDWLRRRKCNPQFFSFEEERVSKIFKGKLKNISFIEEKDLSNSSDLIISMGGDGTLIGVCRSANRNTPPIFGVNLGRLGFITEFNKVELFDELSKVLKGDYVTRNLSIYNVEVMSSDKRVFKGHFVNDAVVNKNDISRMFTLSVEVDEDHVYDLSGDGIIISSPTGSTAYSLAAGGPIIHSSVNGMVLTPICAHSLTHRPLVIPDRSIVKIKVDRRNSPINLTLDGQQNITVDSLQSIHIKRSSLKVKLIENTDRSYFLTLKEKFTHGKRNY
ncbi:MAG: NAD(+)/NADH kinase [Bacteriovoracaceae bacterium]|nr:NAD(+)/NADH kinase [Bacteriovoracaceae bacterium]